MNCKRVEYWLDEYVEGTLPPGKRAAAERHLAACAACRARLRRYREFGRSLTNHMQQATQSLRLRPESERRLLQALREAAPQTARPGLPRLSWAWWTRWLPWAAAACLLAAGALLAAYLAWRPSRGSAASTDSSSLVPIHLSYITPRLTFRQEGAYVIDTLSYETVTADGLFWPEHGRKSAGKQ